MNKKTTTGLLISVLNDKDLDAYEKLILNIVLLSPKRNFYDMETLGDYLGTNRQVISRRMKDLIDKGYLVRTKPRGKNYYLTYATETAKKKYLSMNIKETPKWFDEYEKKLKESATPQPREEDEHDAEYYGKALFENAYMKGQ